MTVLQRSTLLSGADAFAEGWQRGWEVDPLVTVSQCAEMHRVLSGVASSEPGRWRNGRTPYLVEPMDCLSIGSPWKRVVLMFPTQTAKSEAILNLFLYVVRYAPGPVLLVQPSLPIARRFSRQRLAPAIEACAALRDRIREPRSRDSGNTILEKEFPGGILILGGANSAASLASMPIRYLLLDEIDKFKADVDGEGDPIELAEERTSNFPNAKILICSTPTVKGVSAIEREFLQGDRRKFYVPCLHCGFMSTVVWTEDRGPGCHLMVRPDGLPAAWQACRGVALRPPPPGPSALRPAPRPLRPPAPLP